MVTCRTQGNTGAKWYCKRQVLELCIAAHRAIRPSHDTREPQHISRREPGVEKIYIMVSNLLRELATSK